MPIVRLKLTNVQLNDLAKHKPVSITSKNLNGDRPHFIEVPARTAAKVEKGEGGFSLMGQLLCPDEVEVVEGGGIFRKAMNGLQMARDAVPRKVAQQIATTTAEVIANQTGAPVGLLKQAAKDATNAVYDTDLRGDHVGTSLATNLGKRSLDSVASGDYSQQNRIGGHGLRSINKHIGQFIQTIKHIVPAKTAHALASSAVTAAMGDSPAAQALANNMVSTAYQTDMSHGALNTQTGINLARNGLNSYANGEYSGGAMGFGNRTIHHGALIRGPIEPISGEGLKHINRSLGKAIESFKHVVPKKVAQDIASAALTTAYGDGPQAHTMTRNLIDSVYGTNMSNGAVSTDLGINMAKNGLNSYSKGEYDGGGINRKMGKALESFKHIVPKSVAQDITAAALTTAYGGDSGRAGVVARDMINSAYGTDMSKGAISTDLGVNMARNGLNSYSKGEYSGGGIHGFRPAYVDEYYNPLAPRNRMQGTVAVDGKGLYPISGKGFNPIG